MLSLSRKVLILVTVPVLVEVCLFGYISNLVVKVAAARSTAEHARDLGSRFNSIMVLHLRRISLLMVRKLSPEKIRDRSPEELNIIAQVIEQLQALRELVAKDPEENKKWVEITMIMSNIDTIFAEAALAYDQSDDLKAAMAWSRLQHNLDRVFKLSKDITLQSLAVQKESEADYLKYDRELKSVLSLAIFGSVIFTFAIAIAFNYGTSNRIKSLMENTRRLARGQPPDHELRGDDELAAIDQIYHRMHDDLTALRQKERAILDNAADIICSIDEDLRLADINNAALRLWGYEPEALVGKRVLDLVADSQKELAQKKLTEAAEEKAERRFEVSVRKAGGTYADTSWSATWSASERTLYCVISDISERKKLDQLKRDFVAMISHDLRTPLNSTMASLEIVSSPHFTLAPEVRAHVTKAEQNLQVALSLIQQLLEIERMESGVINLEYDAISTREIIEKAINTVAAIAEKRKVEIRFSEANYDLVGDRDRLVQVLVNLLGNALKFSPPGSKITVSEEQRGGRVRIFVADRGRGIPADKMASVFERFQQVNPGDSAEKAGSGLGLAICKAIVEAHKGKIGVTSDVQVGSTFWIELPVE